MLSLSCEALFVYNIKRQLSFKTLFFIVKIKKYKPNSFLLNIAVFKGTAMFFYSTFFIELSVCIPIYNKFLIESLFAAVRISFFYAIKRQKLQFYSTRAPPLLRILKSRQFKIRRLKVKYTYEFSDEENTIEISKYWSNVLIDLDKAESANQKMESRRHYHLESCIYEGIDFVDNNDQIEAMFKEPSKEDILHNAISKLKLKQRDLICAIYFEGVSVNDYAAKEGVKQNAISMRLARAKNNLKKFLEKP